MEGAIAIVEVSGTGTWWEEGCEYNREKWALPYFPELGGGV